MADSQRRIWFTVPMDYIQKLFQMETWHRHSHLRDCTIFHVPRTGATSLYIFSFTTMPWSEEQRVVSEEAAEVLAIAKAQPACKKRLIATGQGEEQRSDEQAVIETVIGKEEAAKMEEMRRSSKFALARRHSSFMPHTLSMPKKLRRSRSFAPEPEGVDYTQNQQEAVADELLRGFLEIQDSLPAHGDHEMSATEKTTSELVKRVAKNTRERRSKASQHHKGRIAPPIEKQKP